jgi:hypothetical protein
MGNWNYYFNRKLLMNVYTFVVTTTDRVFVEAKDDEEAYQKAYDGEYEYEDTINREFNLCDVDFGEEDDN